MTTQVAGGSAYVPGQAMPQDQNQANEESRRIEDPTYVDQARQTVSEPETDAGVQQGQSVLEQVQNDERRQQEDPGGREKGHTDDDRAMLDSVTGMMMADPLLRIEEAQARYKANGQARVPIGQREAGQFTKSQQQQSPDLLSTPPAQDQPQQPPAESPQTQQQSPEETQPVQHQSQTTPPQKEAPLTQQEIYIASTWQINADAANRMGRAILHNVVADLDRSRSQMHQAITQTVEDRVRAQQHTAGQPDTTMLPLVDQEKKTNPDFDINKVDEHFDEDAAAFIKDMDQRQTDRVFALQAENQQLRDEEVARQKKSSDAIYYRWFDERCNQISDGFGGMLGKGSVVEATLTPEADAVRSRLHGLVAGIGQNSPHLTKDQVFDAACNASTELQAAKTNVTRVVQEERIVQRNGQIMGTPETRQQITDDEPWTGEPNQDPVIHNWFNKIAQENGQW